MAAHSDLSNRIYCSLKQLSLDTNKPIGHRQIADYLASLDFIRDLNQLEELKTRLNVVNELLSQGYDKEQIDYCTQAVNQAHRVAAGGMVPKKRQSLASAVVAKQRRRGGYVLCIKMS